MSVVDDIASGQPIDGSKAALSGAVGAFGGVGASMGKSVLGQMGGAALGAGSAQAGIELGEISEGNQTLQGGAANVARTAGFAAGGAGVGAVIGKGLQGSSSFGSAGNLSTAGVGASSAAGELAAGTASEIEKRVND